ncbi:hypothetical protein BRC82_09740 [Halobacteriales archaeon QS_1_67_19]|nr:MAG: hypothetical protein BRC82_09740 [Halobacteriales archaeon QS_1_67_19]
MKRRSVLALAAGSMTTAGLLGAVGSASIGAEDVPGSAEVTEMASGADDPALSAATVETFDHVVRLNDLGDDPRSRITRFRDLDDRERAVADAAIAGEFATTEPPDWLARFVSATPIVERNGTFYRLDDDFPTYRITAEPATESEVEEIASYDTYERAVTRENYAMTRLLEVARRETVELSYVWDDLEAFLDRYDAVRYHGDIVAFSVAEVDPGPPYTVSAARVPVSETVDGSVWDATDAPDPTRRLVREAGSTRGAFGFDREPPGVPERLRDHDYAYLDGTFYAATVEKDGSVPLSISAATTDDRLRLSVRNESDRELRFSSGPPRPFGVLRCRSTDGADARSLLWTDRYAASDRVRVVAGDVRQRGDVAVTTTVGPGEAVGETYAVGNLSGGEYVIADSIELETASRSQTVRYRATFSVA